MLASLEEKSKVAKEQSYRLKNVDTSYFDP